MQMHYQGYPISYSCVFYDNKLKSYFIKNYQAMNGSSSNPSDYQFLLRTLTQGNHVAKAQSLKRFNTLILSDKKQFASYAKRIVIAIQDLMLQQKQDVNLLACTLALEIINLNPRDIEFYIKSKLLKPMVINLGDTKPQIRKTSHYCLLAYIRTFKNFDDLIEAYIMNGIMSKQWQLRQKSINSFQSILVMEMRYVDWSSSQFKRIFQLLLAKLKDQNGFVQKASQQCLLSLSKVEEVRNFSKRLSPVSYNLLRSFCQQQFQLGNLHQIKLDQKKIQSQRYNEPIKYERNTPLNTTSQKMEMFRPDQNMDLKTVSLNINQEPEETYRRKPQRKSLKKAESTMGSHQTKQLQYSVNMRQIKNPQRQSSLLLPPISNINVVQTNRLDKIEQIVGKKLIQDLRNDKDWKVRLQAIQQLQTKFQVSRQQFELDVLMKNLVPILIKLLGDANFKVALVALKIIQQILRMPQINLELIVPQIVDKLSDNKVALRQNISKLIRGQYALSKQPIWLDNLLIHIKKSANSNIKEEVLNILYKVYDQGNVPYSFQRILQLVCPLMDDLKTKIKIKTLDLLAIITIKSQKIDRAKNILASKMNQVYYEMYLQKIGKQLKSYRQAHPQIEKQANLQKQKPMRTSMNHLNRKLNKVGNTTSTSLQRYANNNTQAEPNSTVKTVFYQPSKQDQKIDTIASKQDAEHYQAKMPQISHIDNSQITDDETASNKKIPARHLRRRAQKSLQSRLSTTNYSNDDAYPPFHDPQKQLKNIMIELKSDDWQISNEALTKLRRIIMHHSQLLVSSVTRNIIPDVIKLSESLRSTLSKSALVIIHQISNKVKKQLDSQFDLMFSKLIKKSLDTNTFISQEVKKALITVCSNCNEAKVINSLNTSHISRAIPIKIAVVNILQGITFLPKFYEKQLQKIVGILNDFMNEGSLQIRQKTKALLNSILASQKGYSILKLIPNEHKNKLKKLQQLSPNVSKSQLKIQSLMEDKKASQVCAQKQSQQVYPRKKKKNKITNFPDQFEDLDGYLQHCQSSDWKIRLQNMTLISQIISKYTQQILQYRSSSRIIDVLSKQINDPNVKVATNALKIFQDLTSKIPTLIQASLSVIMNQIFICFSSAKNEIRALAEQLFDSISLNVQKWMLTQHMCNGALYSIQKSKSAILQKLTQLIPQIHKAKPNIFQKNVYPMINKLAQENKPQMMGPLRQLLAILYTEIGQDCMSYLKQKAKQLIIQ